jgi:hypothetical protein
MKKLTMLVTILLFTTSGFVFAEQPTLNVRNSLRTHGQTIDMETEPGYRSDLLFDQPAANPPWNLGSSQWDSISGLDSKLADNFDVPYQANVDSVVWWGGYWNYGADTNDVIDFWVEIYPDSTGNNQPMQDPIYSERVPFEAVDLGIISNFHYYRYSAVIPPFLADPGETYWIVFTATLIYQPQYGMQIDTFPAQGDGQIGYFKSTYFGYPEWTPTSALWGSQFETAFQIYGTAPGVEEEYTDITTVGDISFNSITNDKIRFKIFLHSPLNVEARIFDLTGRMVGTMVNAQLPAGENVCEHSKTLPTGVYFVSIKAGNITKMGKILVVR